MSRNDKYRKPELIIFLILWMIIFMMPVLLSIESGRLNSVRITHELIRIILFFFLFLINNFLVYRFFEKKKYIHYAVVIFSVILVLSFFSSFNHVVFDLLKIPQPEKMTPGALIINDYRTLEIYRNLFNKILLSILVVGLNNSIKITFSWMEDRKNFEELQKENLKTELAYLQHQVSPHFLMNTLNNIHALIDIDKETAKNSIIKLSKLMRVLLYETEKNNFTLQKEIDFLNDYIELMRIRTNENTETSFIFPDNIPHVRIQPLLFVNFVENAFKHGIRASGRSFIHIKFELLEEYLFFEISNSKQQFSVPDTEKIGLNNSKKRLDLLYKDNHSFEVIDDDDTYKVKIKIPVRS
ncbi:MAG: histidine kinase [Candidatus Delongbacteria bacterium]|nr:histidine kinase [Candidatus Delongbacteria bacterium]